MKNCYCLDAKKQAVRRGDKEKRGKRPKDDRANDNDEFSGKMGRWSKSRSPTAGALADCAEVMARHDLNDDRAAKKEHAPINRILSALTVPKARMIPENIFMGGIIASPCPGNLPIYAVMWQNNPMETGPSAKKVALLSRRFVALYVSFLITLALRYGGDLFGASASMNFWPIHGVFSCHGSSFFISPDFTTCAASATILNS